MKRLAAYLSTLDPRSFQGIFGTSEAVLKRSIANCRILLAGVRESLRLDPGKTLTELRGVFRTRERGVREGIRGSEPSQETTVSKAGPRA